MRDHVMNKSIVITGGSSGIGLALASQLLMRGARVTIGARSQERLEKAEQSLEEPERLLAVPFDATRKGDWEQLLEQVRERFERIDVLVANHGAGIRIAPLEEQSESQIEESIQINLTSTIKGCKAALPIMRRQGRGHILTVGSACSYHSWPEWSVYTAAKAGLVGFTRCLHLEMVQWGGKATFVAPGATRTGFQQAAGLDKDMAGLPEASDMAAVMLHVIDVPPHVVIENVSAWGTEQVITPF